MLPRSMRGTTNGFSHLVAMACLPRSIRPMTSGYWVLRRVFAVSILDRGRSFDQVSGSTFINESIAVQRAFQVDPRIPTGSMPVVEGNGPLPLDRWSPGRCDSRQPGWQSSPDSIEILANDQYLVAATASRSHILNGQNTGKIRFPRRWINMDDSDRTTQSVLVIRISHSILRRYPSWRHSRDFRKNPTDRSQWRSGLDPFGEGLPPPFRPICVIYDPRIQPCVPGE